MADNIEPTRMPRRSRPREPDTNAKLAGRRPRQELAQGHEMGESTFVEPLATHDEFIVEIAEMRYQPTKRGESKSQECQEYSDRDLDHSVAIKVQFNVGLQILRLARILKKVL